MMRRAAIAAVVIFATTALQAATTYRVTTTVKERLKRIPSVERVIADGDNRRLTIEQQDEPFTHDILLSGDGGKTVTALNTPLQTWFDFAILVPAARLKPRSNDMRPCAPTLPPATRAPRRDSDQTHADSGR